MDPNFKITHRKTSEEKITQNGLIETSAQSSIQNDPILSM